LTKHVPIATIPKKPDGDSGPNVSGETQLKKARWIAIFLIGYLNSLGPSIINDIAGKEIQSILACNREILSLATSGFSGCNAGSVKNVYYQCIFHDAVQ
jgi:hypothetical protein